MNDEALGCRVCHSTMSVPFDLEPTGICNPCAQSELDRLLKKQEKYRTVGEFLTEELDNLLNVLREKYGHRVEEHRSPCVYCTLATKIYGLKLEAKKLS